MPQYRISFKSSAARELKKMPLELQRRVANKIEQLVEDPRLSGVIKLKGDDDLYRCRVGEYRLVYQIDDSTQKIVVTRVRHRKDVYR
jgi:mRNA interferase RelE/StbE